MRKYIIQQPKNEQFNYKYVVVTLKGRKWYKKGDNHKGKILFSKGFDYVYSVF